MIDTSKAVRPCVEELAAYVNNSYVPYSPQPMFRWWDVAQYFTSGETAFRGTTVTNNNDGTFTVSGTFTSTGALSLSSQITIPFHNRNPKIIKQPLGGYNIVLGSVACFFNTILHEQSTAELAIFLNFTINVTINGVQSTKTMSSPFRVNASVGVNPLQFLLTELPEGSTIEVDPTIKLQFTLRSVSTGSCNLTFSILTFDTLELYGTDSVDNFYNMFYPFSPTQKVLYAVRHCPEIINTVNMCMLEHALWKKFNGEFLVQCNNVSTTIFNDSFKHYSFPTNS